MSTPRRGIGIREIEKNEKKVQIKDEEKLPASKYNKISERSKNKIDNLQMSKHASTSKNQSVIKSSEKQVKRSLVKDVAAPIIKSKSNLTSVNTAPKRKAINPIQTIPLHFIDKKSPRVNVKVEPKIKETRVKQSGVYNQKNVTINSPKRKQKITTEPEPSSSRTDNNKPFDIVSNNHKRHRTRTLDPDEVKVINKLSVKDTENVNVIFPPETFFVPLNHEVVLNKSPIDSGDDSYEDDFESYESDFDSYASSNSSNPEGDQIQAKAKIEEEKKFDSGNYELGDTFKSKSEKHLEKINEVIEKNTKLTHYTSLTDEGFDENSVGLASLNQNVDSNRKRSKRCQRSRDLKNIIVLDEVYYSLFEMIPMPYDTFIANYGKSNRCQVSCQTGDDDVDSESQTDVVSNDNKWTQFPIEFSTHSINEINPISAKKSHHHESNDNHVRIPYLELYTNQRTGSGSDVTNRFEINATLNKTDVLKLSRFMSNVGRFMLDYLNERQNNESNKSYDLKTIDNDTLQFLKKRSIRNIFPSQYHSNIFLTSHPPNDKDNSDGGNKIIICLWELNNNTFNPIKLLLTSDEVICCSVNYGGSNGIVVAGLEYGNICAWDLTENEMWHDDASKGAITMRRPSFHTSCDVAKRNNSKKYQWGSVVDVTFVRFTNGNNIYVDYEGSNFNSDQVYSLQEYGVLTIWTLIRMTRELEKITKLSNYDFYDSYWSNVSLIRANVVDLKSYLGSEWKYFKNTTYKKKEIQNKSSVYDTESIFKSDDYDKKGIATAFSDEDDFLGEVLINKDKSVSNTTNNDCIIDKWEKSIICNSFKNIESKKALLIVCNRSEIINYIQSGLRKKPFVYTCGDVGSTIADIEECPSDLNYFLTNCGNIIHLYSFSFGKPIKNFNCNHDELCVNDKFLNTSFEENLLNVIDFQSSDTIGWKKFATMQWCSPYAIIKVYGNTNIAIWDLMKSDMAPKTFLGIQRDGEDRIVDMNILYQNRNTTKCYMMVHMYSGKLKIYRIDKKHLDCSKYANDDLKLLKTYFQLL